MLLRKLQMLKKLGINKGNAINYLEFIVRIVHVCAEKQVAVKPSDAIGGEEKEPAFIVVSWWNSYRSLTLPYRFPYPPKFLFIF